MPRNTVTLIVRFTPEANALPTDDLVISVPFHVLLGEAVDVARFYERYYDSMPPKDGKPGRRGFDTVENKKQGLTAGTGKEIMDLREAVQQAQTAYLASVSPRGTAPMERGRALVDELSSTLEWHFDDGVVNERDAQLSTVVQMHESTPDSADALAAELDDYAALASMYRAEIDGVGGFDAKTIDEAKKVAVELRDRPASPATPGEETRQALALRNRLATLLNQRMNLVRSAARFVFRGSPEIVRESTSAYERRRRAAARRTPEKTPATPA